MNGWGEEKETGERRGGGREDKGGRGRRTKLFINETRMVSFTEQSIFRWVVLVRVVRCGRPRP